MITGNGINTVTVNGKVKHITELDDITLCLEWTKLREENNRLYEINNQANRGWRGFILRLIGVNLPDKRTEFTQRLLLTRKISGSVGFAPIFPDTCYHLTHHWPTAADIPVASDNPAHYADAIRYNARTPLQGSLLPLTRLVWA